MVQTSARLLRVLSLLQSRRFWAGADLARELGVTERSVRRDIDRLRSLGYPVHATAGVGGGYQLGAGKELPPLPLEDEEAVAVAVGLRAAATGVVTGLEEASMRALAKLEQVLPKRLRRRVNTLQSVSVRIQDAGPRVNAEVLTALANACRDSEGVRFDYRNRSGTPTARRVEPYRLVHTSSRWYLLAFDLDKEEWRTFRVDRIASKPKPDRRFQPRALPSDDIAAYVSQSVSTDVYRYRAHATVFAPADEVRRRWSGLAARVEPIDGQRCSVRTGGNGLEGLAFHLAYLGFDFEVHEPPELIDHLRAMSARLARAARRRRRSTS
ncbi:MAG: YafY family transcriptional regulator [Myxococcaceae bacterium]|nr:YafY family transcriptional regulator [Myxococcaceae bacterium]